MELALDNVLPPTEDMLENFNRWANVSLAQLMAVMPDRTKIEIKNETEGETIARRTAGWPLFDPDPRHCGGHGHAACMRQGQHDHFNHAMDSYYTNNESNLPPGFREED